MALLRYEGGGTRLMTMQEANGQLEGASKLPRDFWRPIELLQTPVTSIQAGRPTRHITYRFDIASPDGAEPVAPSAPRSFLVERSASAPTLQQAQRTALARQRRSVPSRVAAFPRRLNELLAKQKAATHLEIISGQFEFVLDEADGGLWLINASELRCRRKEERREVEEEVDETPLFFDEAEFAAALQEQEQQFSKLRRRFGGGDPDPSSERGLGVTAPALRSAADRLDNAEIPGDFVKYFDMQSKLNYCFHDDILPLFASIPPVSGAAAVSVWFKRWANEARARTSARIGGAKARARIGGGGGA